MNIHISDEHYEKLKIILEKQNYRTYTIEEIHEIGNDLIELFEILGDDQDLRNYVKSEKF